MASIHTTATRTHTAALGVVAGISSCEYHRAPYSATGLTLVRSRSEWPATRIRTGLIVSTESTDFLITALELVINSALTLPERNDLIKVPDGSNTLVYQVLPHGPDDRVYTRTGDQLRIHCRFKETETN